MKQPKSTLWPATVDRLGRFVSLGCGIHCALLTWVSAAIPSVWLSQSWLGMPVGTLLHIERLLACLTLAFAAASIVMAYISGMRWRSSSLLASGSLSMVIAFINGLHTVPLWGPTTMLGCTLLIAAGHWLRLRDRTPLQASRP